MNWKIKLPLVIVAIIFTIYSILWVKITSDISSTLNQKMSTKMMNVTQSHRVEFTGATSAGFPFSIGVNLHEVIEDTSKAVIHHKNPVFVGYNLFTQELFMHYWGESAIETKDSKTVKNLTSTGEFRYSVKMPLSLNEISNNISTSNAKNILSNIQNIKVEIKNAELKNATDEQDIAKNVNIDLALIAKHHRKYHTLEEIMLDIPQNYEIIVNIDNEYLLEGQDTISPSVIYGLYLPFSLKYNLKTTLHTGAKTFAISDILRDIQIPNWESSISNDVEDSKSKLNFAAHISEHDISCDFNNESQFKIKPNYSKKIDKSLKMLFGIVPSTVLGDAKSIMRQLDFASLNLDTKNDAVAMDLKFGLNFTEKPGLLKIDIPHLGISFRDVALDIKNVTNAHLNVMEGKKWTSDGVISIKQYPILAEYLIDNYFNLYNIPENQEFNNVFYLKVLLDVMHKLANDVNPDNVTVTIDYNLQSSDITKSKLGKFTLPEMTVLYYASLLKHTNALAKDSTEAMTKFKTIVPDYILQPEALDKIIIQSKE